MALAPLSHALGVDFSVLTHVASNVTSEHLCTITEDEEYEEEKSPWTGIRHALFPQYHNLPQTCAPRRIQPGARHYLYPSLLACWSRCWLKGFTSSVAFLTALSIIPSLWNPTTRLSAMNRGKLKDHIRNGLFFGTWNAMYNTILFSKGKSPEQRRKWAGLTAFLASSSIVLAPPKAMYFASVVTFLRACEICWKRYATSPEFIRRCSGAILMGASSAQVASALLRFPSTLDPRFLGFLRQLTTHVDPVTEVPQSPVSAVTSPVGRSSLGALENSPAPTSTAIQILRHSLLSLKLGLRVYAPTSVISFLVFRAFRVQSTQFPRSVGTMTLDLLRSLSFVSAGSSLYWLAARYVSARFLPLVVGLIAAAITKLEKRSKRLELALYVASHALHSVLQRFNFPLLLGKHKTRVVEYLIFSFSAAVIMQAYADEDPSLRAPYRFFFRYFFDGKSKRHKALFKGMLPNLQLQGCSQRNPTTDAASPGANK
eukprot:GEMP01036986.1.p1 GENE.GEMP01036986.1~~GEMP01036986.1.p1  ORF type:complete len:499 (+),score=55.61 GEMP01036986.1:43-1497(+)